MGKLLQVVNTLALLGILAVLILILLHLPQQQLLERLQTFPTYKDFRDAARPGDRARLLEVMMSVPLVHVIDGTITVRSDDR